ncbi:unnamed protein product [Sphenostylis stenocarpa]|uniref:U3 small nucleolar ribonucleoprotein protein MPP10 n=1 Tax=Sphenostylis stenocarpa TaxID=92480 RepID=A0AA86SYX9_9FABA|nr:unnamed protein product [Sphenostylis stenocarpa]
METASDTGLEALRRLKATDAPRWLAPNPELSEAARTASQYLFSTLKPFCPKSPLDQLLVDGFDAEQIWQQIDIQSQPLLSTLRRRLKQLAENPEEISRLKVPSANGSKVEAKSKDEWEGDRDDFDEELDEDDEDEADEDEAKEGEEGMEQEDEDEEEEEEKEQEDEENEEGGGIEDKFLKIDELAKYLDKEEEDFENGEAAREGEEEDDDEESDEVTDDDFGVGDEDDEADDMENARYDDFFGGKKERGSKRKAQVLQESEYSEDEDGREFILCIYAIYLQLENIQSKIQQMEKANIEPKTWTMQGEVTAAKRPKNSALEVDLDFEHNVRPAPVITEEVTASIEDMIKKRIIEGFFNDVQRLPKLPSKAPREVKELDDNKSKQGLAEIYEQEYVQKTDPTSAPLSFKDEQKNEVQILASMLFKRLCLKLDALSHFNFAPKPVIEDMSIQANVPALAMEEIAPVAVSDAAMLAPEEVFDGKGDIKEEVELTQAERKRRRANKKRKFKDAAVKKTKKKAQEGAIHSQANG